MSEPKPTKRIKVRNGNGWGMERLVFKWDRRKKLFVCKETGETRTKGEMDNRLKYFKVTAGVRDIKIKRRNFGQLGNVIT